MKDIMGDQVNADSATHNIDTGEYQFVFTTPLQPDSAVAGFDQRAVRAGWSVEKRDRLFRVYTRRKQETVNREGYGCISIRPRQAGGRFEFMYRTTMDC